MGIRRDSLTDSSAFTFVSVSVPGAEPVSVSIIRFGIFGKFNPYIVGVGFERTEVSLNADPAARGNTHLVEVEGPCGTMRIELSNKPFPDNPKTSMLAGLSLLRVIRNRSEAVQV